MEGVVPILIALILLILASAYFSATETAFSSMNKIRLKNWANNGDAKADATIKISNDFDKLITDILVGNNIVNITAASLGTILFAKLVQSPDLAVTLSTISITLVVLVFGEILPKTLAKAYPEKFAMFSTPIIKFIGIILFPISYIFRLMQKNVKKKTGDDTSSVIVTNDELITIIQEAENEGELDANDSDLIKSAIEFNDVAVEEILIPRVDIIAVDETDSMEEIYNIFKENTFSRLPVYKDDIDHIIGFLHQKDFFISYFEKKDNIKDIIQKVHVVSLQTSVSELLSTLQKNKQHMAIVIDEFGGTAGLVTMEDCLEELVGEIYDEHDNVIEMVQQVDENTYLINGNEDLEEAFELLEIKTNEEFESNTIGGWVIEMLEKVPEKGLKFEYQNVIFEIVEIGFRRVKIIKAKNKLIQTA